MCGVGEQTSRDPCEPLASAPLTSILTPLPPARSSIPASVHLCTPGPSGSSPHLSHSSCLLNPQMELRLPLATLRKLSWMPSPTCPSFLCTFSGLTRLSFLPPCLLLPALPHPPSASPVESMVFSSPTALVVPIGAGVAHMRTCGPKGQLASAPISGPIS